MNKARATLEIPTVNQLSIQHSGHTTTASITITRLAAGWYNEDDVEARVDDLPPDFRAALRTWLDTIDDDA